MKTIYETVIEQVREGSQFNVNFKTRTLKLNHKKVDLTKKPVGIKMFDNLDQWLDEVENLYDAYKYSRPTKASCAKERKAYFKALTIDELVDELGYSALDNPISRDEAQAELEVFILLSLVSNAFNPDELFNKDWFFQGADKSLVIYKTWF